MKPFVEEGDSEVQVEEVPALGGIVDMTSLDIPDLHVQRNN